MPRRFDGVTQNTRPASKEEDGIQTDQQKLEDANASADATPGAIDLANENGVNLLEADIDGSGEDGRIWIEDVQSYIEDQPAP